MNALDLAVLEQLLQDPGGLLPPHEVARLHQLLADAQLRERRRQARRRLLLLAGLRGQILLRHGWFAGPGRLPARACA